jgi:hypothetical protein
MAAAGWIFERSCIHQSDFLRIKQLAEKISGVQQTLISFEFFASPGITRKILLFDETNMRVADETPRAAFAAADLSTAPYTLP